MIFQGRIYYDFSLPVWTFYRFLTAASNEGAELRLEWRPFLAESDPQSAAGLALVESVRRQFPDRHGALQFHFNLGGYVSGAKTPVGQHDHHLVHHHGEYTPVKHIPITLMALFRDERYLYARFIKTEFEA